MNNKLAYILIINLLLAFPDCDHGNPNWEELYESVPFDYEFNATIAAAQIFIDDIEMTNGKLAGFVTGAGVEYVSSFAFNLLKSSAIM